MKKILTVSLFAMMAVSAANADIASTKYVGDQITATAGTLGNLTTTEKANLVGAINEVKGQITSVSEDQGDALSAVEQSLSDLEDRLGSAAFTESTAYDAAGSASNAQAAAIDAAKTETTNQVNALANGAVKTNTDKIEAMDTAYKAADSALDGRVDALEGDNTTNKNNITNLQTAVNALNTGDNSVSNKIAKALEDYSTTTEMNTAIADNAVNTVMSGTANGTIKVDGTDVAVKGLGSAAYTASTAYDAAGSASNAQAAAIAAAKTETTNQVNALANGAVKTNTDEIAAINDSAVMKSGVDSDVVAKAKSAMQETALKGLATWTSQGCETGTCSLVSKNGDIAWEKVSY